MHARQQFSILAVVVFASLFVLPIGPSAQGGGGGDHTGDMYGDLIHIKRDAVTGQPILQKRWTELPQDQFDWAYCPIPIDAVGNEIPFAALSCDPDPAYLDQVVEVDYFGRLSSGRTQERNQRMHFDEMIDNVKASAVVDVDDAGRLKLGSDCDVSGICATWKTIDSPMENLALYRRVLKYGHVQTDPMEIDTSVHGDPAAGTQYHPALSAEDWAKFRGVTRTLLPSSDPSTCFSGGAFVASCAEAQPLSQADFVVASSFLGGSSDKTGKVTVDLVEYLNRILKIPVATAESSAALNTLPALIRDENGAITPATSDLPAPANERFLDFSAAQYVRTEWFSRATLALQTFDAGLTWLPTSVNLLEWLAFANGPLTPTYVDVNAFVANANDALRVVEFIHNYEVPADLWTAGEETTTTVTGTTVEYRAAPQEVTLEAAVSGSEPVSGGLEAAVSGSGPVSGGSVTFLLQTPTADAVGSPTSGSVVNGKASVKYVLPAGTLPQTLSVVGVYGGTGTMASSTGHGSLVIGQAHTLTNAMTAHVPKSDAPQSVPLHALVVSNDSTPISHGHVTFTVTDAVNGVVGTPVTAPVVGGAATASYPLPGSLTPQRLTTTATFSGCNEYASSAGIGVLSAGCLPVTVLPASLPRGTVLQAYSQTFSSDATAPLRIEISGSLPPGLKLTGANLTGTPTRAGLYRFTVTMTEATGCTGAREYELLIGSSGNALVTGTGRGFAGGLVRVYERDGYLVNPPGDLVPYGPEFSGGTRVASADVNGDGTADVIVGAGPGGGPHVVVYEGKAHEVVRSFMAFGAGFTGGVFVAGGDVNNDGFADIITGAGEGGEPHVRVFDAGTGAELRSLLAFEQTFTGGVRVASADLNGDGFAEIVTAAGAGSEPRVRVFDGATGGLTMELLAYAKSFRGGVFVAAADVNGDGFGDIVTGAGEGGGPHVRVFDGRTSAELRGFFAFDPGFSGGVRVAAADLNGDGKAEVVAAAGPGGGPHVAVFDGATGEGMSGFFAYPQGYASGVYVAARTRVNRMVVDQPVPAAAVAGTFTVSGWAIDESAPTGAGVDVVHAWAFPAGGGTPMFLGAAAVGVARPDVAAVYGESYGTCGFTLDGALPAGTYDIAVFAHNPLTGTFTNYRVVRVTVN